MRRLRPLAVAALAALSPEGASAQNVHYEFWPEVQVNVRLGEALRLLTLANVSRARDSGTRLEGQLGVALDYRIAELLSVRGGYRFAQSLEPGESRTEHRILLEQTLHFRLPAEFELAMRTRQDFRFVNGKFSARIRERAALERPVAIEGYTFVPYTSAEIFYDTRYDAFSRSRFTLGSVFPMTKHMSVDLYYARQDDWRSEPKRVNAWGMTLMLSF